MRDYKELFALGLSIAVNCGVDDPEDIAQEAVVALWVNGECRDPRAWIAVAVRRMATKEWAGREETAAAGAKVRFRPRKEDLWEVDIGTSGFEQVVMEKVLVEEIRKRWKWPGKRLKEVRAWALG